MGQGARVHVMSYCAAPRLSMRRLCRHGCCCCRSRLCCHFRRQLLRLLQLIRVQLSEPNVHITKQLAVAAKQAAAAAFAAAAGIQQGRSTACRCCLKGGCWGAARQRAQAARRAQAAACLAAGSAGAREGAGGRPDELDCHECRSAAGTCHSDTARASEMPMVVPTCCCRRTAWQTTSCPWTAHAQSHTC